MTHLPAAQPPFAKRGYAAITSIIIILAVVVVVGMTTSILSIGNAQMSLGQSKSESTLALVESCIEDALLRYNELAIVPTTLTTPLGDCTLTLDSSTDTSATFTTTAQIPPHSHSIQVTVDRVDNVTVVNWIQTN